MHAFFKVIRSIIDRFNALPIFNPVRWPFREKLGRITALTVVCVYFLSKMFYFDPLPRSFEATNLYYLALNSHYGLSLFDANAVKILWLSRWAVWSTENAILMGYLIAYLTRFEAIDVARGVEEVLFPFIVAALPMIMALAPVNFTHYLPVTSKYYLIYYAVVMGLIFTGACVNLVGLLTMRRAFSIMSEARVLVTGGIFRFIRHPLYTGHFILFFGSLCLRLHSYTVLLYLLFVVGQFIRARIEEKKLTIAFPEYASYKQVTGMFLPRRRRWD